MKEERDMYLKENKSTRANGYYTRTPKTILGQMKLSIPRTRDGGFKSEVLPQMVRKKHWDNLLSELNQIMEAKNQDEFKDKGLSSFRSSKTRMRGTHQGS